MKSSGVFKKITIFTLLTLVIIPNVITDMNNLVKFNEDNLILWNLKVPSMYIEWNPSGTMLVAITYTSLTLISFEGKIIDTIQDINVQSASWNRNDYLAFTYWSKEEDIYYLAIYEPGKGIISKFPLAEVRGGHIKWSPDGKNIILYTGREILMINLMNSTLTIKKEIELPLPGTLGFSWSNNGTKLAITGQWNVFVFTKDLEIYKKIYFGKLFPPEHLAWSPDDKYIAVGGREGYVCIVDSNSGDIVSCIKVRYKSGIRDIVWVSKNILIAGDYEDYVHFLKIENDNIYEINRIRLDIPHFHCFALHPSREYIAISLYDRIILYNVSKLMHTQQAISTVASIITSTIIKTVSITKTMTITRTITKTLSSKYVKEESIGFTWEFTISLIIALSFVILGVILGRFKR